MSKPWDDGRETVFTDYEMHSFCALNFAKFSQAYHVKVKGQFQCVQLTRVVAIAEDRSKLDRSHGLNTWTKN